MFNHLKFQAKRLIRCRDMLSVRSYPNLPYRIVAVVLISAALLPILNFCAGVKTVYGPREVLLPALLHSPSLLLLSSTSSFLTHAFADAIPEDGIF